MAGENTVATLNGIFKETYADKVENLKPEMFKAQTDFKFVPKKQQPGNQFHQPVSLTHEHGFTYSAANAGAFAIDPAVAGVHKDATIVGTQLLLRSQLDYESASRAARGGPNAYRAAVQLLFENMVSSMGKRIEIDLFNGKRSLGEIQAIASDVITFAEKDWATGIWAGNENAKLEIFTTLADSATQRSGTAVVTAVDIANRQVTIDATPSGTVAGDFVFFKTQRTTTAHNVFPGVHEILANTGTLFGINAANFSLWTGNTIDIGSTPLAFQEVNTATAVATGKGLEQDLCLYCSPRTWSTLLDEEVSHRRWMGAGRPRYEVGGEEITFYSQSGKVVIKASNYVKEGLAYLLPPKLFKRVGATDVTFNLPDRGDEFFRHIESNAGYELRAYSNQALFTHAPGMCTLITGIVNS